MSEIYQVIVEVCIENTKEKATCNVIHKRVAFRRELDMK